MATRLSLMKRVQKLVGKGAILAYDSPVRLDEIEVFEDMFGQETSEVDLAIEGLCTAQPTGHRTWSSADDADEHFMIQDCTILD